MTTITIRCTVADLMGDTTDVDAVASVKRYLELVAAAVEVEYPDATIETEYLSRQYQTLRDQAYAIASSDQDEDTIRARVYVLAERVFDSGDWIVDA